MVGNIVFFIIFIIPYSSAYFLIENDDPESSIIWPSEFYYNGEEIDLVNSHIETVEVWYSDENNRSRIDYYNGANKVYYYIGETDVDTGNRTAYELTIYPYSTEEKKNQILCVKERTKDLPDFLPDIEDLEYSHEEIIDGNQVRVWTKEAENEEEVLIQSSLFVYRTNYDFDVPFKLITKEVNPKKGELQSHTIKHFKQFSFIIDNDDLTPDEEICGNEHYTDFNSQIAYLHPHNPLNVDKAFNSYKNHHGKTYGPTEHELRKAIFHRNWRRVHAHNRKNSTYKMELNAFADRTKDELKFHIGALPSSSTALGSMPFPHTAEEITELAKELPGSYDMRFQGFLGPVKNQGDCGSCWAFAATATVEAALSKANGGRNLDLSEQSLVDCSWGFDNRGCNGGMPSDAYEYILKHGIPLESQYGEYIKKNNYCNITNTTDTFKIRGFAKVSPRNPDALKVALMKYGAVSVTIFASDNMYFYSNGVFYDIECEGEPLNHAVVVVGYGERDGTPYWIIRNSWGENWGQDGYILMSALNDNCLVLDNPYYPIA